MQATGTAQRRFALDGRRVRRLLPLPPALNPPPPPPHCCRLLAGSHTSLALLEEGYEVVIYDDLSNSYLECYERLKELAGPAAAQRLTFVQVC